MPEPEHSDPSSPDPLSFDPDEADVDDDLRLRSAFSEALATQGLHNTLVLTRERADDVFHDRRLEIIDYLKEHEPSSVRALASELGYDKGVVSRDLKRLAKIDVIEFVENGKAKAPRLKHRHVVVEPIV
jgi:DNA-binding transcriptional ArsR family regulator